jgi:hypothetical protein
MTNDVKLSNGTWTDESLPTSKRRELLAQDLEKFHQRRAPQKATASDATSGKPELPSALQDARPARERSPR